MSALYARFKWYQTYCLSGISAFEGFDYNVYGDTIRTYCPLHVSVIDHEGYLLAPLHIFFIVRWPKPSTSTFQMGRKHHNTEWACQLTG